MPTVLYGAETLGMAVAEKKLNVMGTRCSRSVWSNHMDPVISEEMRRRTGVIRKMAGPSEQSALK